MKRRLSLRLFEIGAVKFGSFRLKSGLESPLYIDLRQLISFPDLLREVSEELWKLLPEERFDHICGVPYTALPIACSLSLSRNIPLLIKRKEKKEHGTKKLVEGVFQAGESCLVIEDLITSGQSLLETIGPLEQEGLVIRELLVCLDRQQGGRERLEALGYRVHALITLEELLEELVLDRKLSQAAKEEALDFLCRNTF